MACIEFQNISLTLSKNVILNDVNAVFKTGFNLIYGHSGSGKTSLLKLINMLYLPKKGRILYENKDISRFDVNRWRSFCMLTKQITPLADESVLSNILLPFSFKVNKNKKLDESLMYNLLEIFNLDKDILNKSAIKLSGGESQRIALIRTILLKPEVYLFDEPTSALDVDTQKSVFSYIKKISESSICIVASHSKEALAFGDFVFKLEKGEFKGV